MRGEPRYALETLDAVLRAMGCRAETSHTDGQTRAWGNPRASWRGVLAIATFRADSGEMSIGQGAIVTIALQLDLDPAELVRRVADSGGQILDP